MGEVRNIALCDDGECYREQLTELIRQYEEEKGFTFVVDKYSAGTEFLEKVLKADKNYEIVFLDVDMPDMQGTDVAARLRQAGCQAVLCFVTAYEHYAFQAYDVAALDYIVKPVTLERLEKFMEKAIDWCRLQKEKREAGKSYLTIRQKHDSRTINQEDILYIEKKRNQCIVFTDTEELICYNTLQNIYEQLNQSKFVYTHQGYIANFYQIKEIRDNVAFMGAEKTIPISRKHQGPLKRRFEEKLERLRMERVAYG